MNEKQFIKTTAFKTLYYSDKAMTELHREDGPAVEYADGTKSWYINGKLHREDGPAVVHNNGYKDLYYIHGRRVNEDGTPFDA